MRKISFFTFALVLAAARGLYPAIHTELITLPPGFEISVYAARVPNARAMAFGDKGTLFVGSMNAGKVYAVPAGGDPEGGMTRVIASALHMPAGVAFYKGDLYVSAVNRILKYADIESSIDTPPAPVVVSEAFPKDTWHGWKFIRFGPDGLLYVPVGAPCNVCAEKGMYASITRLKPGGKPEIYARGIRNTVGFDWDPRDGSLWFTENGRDLMGDDTPPDELDRAPGPGMHFGFPYIHGASVKDPKYYPQKPADLRVTLPAAELGAHVAALGMRFYTGSMFPKTYKNSIFWAEHGSWNRSKKSGYRVMTAKVSGGKVTDVSVFAQGWKQGEEAWGRPVDVEMAPDGSLLVSDDRAGVIYRISYRGL